jgi:hypothetical protein
MKVAGAVVRSRPGIVFVVMGRPSSDQTHPPGSRPFALTHSIGLGPCRGRYVLPNLDACAESLPGTGLPIGATAEGVFDTPCLYQDALRLRPVGPHQEVGLRNGST